MKLRSLSFLFVFIIIFVLISWSGPQGEKTDGAKLSDDNNFKAEMAGLKDVVDKIKEKKKNLSEKFKNKDFDGISKMYVNDAVIVTPEGDVLKGRGQIKKYWKELGEKKKVKEVIFEVESVIKRPKKIKIGNEEFDCVIYECSKVTFVNTNGGKELESKSLSNCAFWLHRVDCEEYCMFELFGF